MLNLFQSSPNPNDKSNGKRLVYEIRQLNKNLKDHLHRWLFSAYVMVLYNLLKGDHSNNYTEVVNTKTDN